MSKFKVGDKVRCIDAVHSYLHSLQHGRAYVIATLQPGTIDLVYLRENNHSPAAHRTAHWASRFEKVQSNPGKKR